MKHKKGRDFPGPFCVMEGEEGKATTWPQRSQRNTEVSHQAQKTKNLLLVLSWLFSVSSVAKILLISANLQPWIKMIPSP